MMEVFKCHFVCHHLVVPSLACVYIHLQPGVTEVHASCLWARTPVCPRVGGAVSCCDPTVACSALVVGKIGLCCFSLSEDGKVRSEDLRRGGGGCHSH